MEVVKRLKENEIASVLFQLSPLYCLGRSFNLFAHVGCNNVVYLSHTFHYFQLTYKAMPCFVSERNLEIADVKEISILRLYPIKIGYIIEFFIFK